QSSGVQVDQDVIGAFKEIKSKKSHAYVVMKIEDKKKIVVEKRGSKLPPNCSQTRNEEIFNEMKNSLGEEPRYIVFDFCFTRSNQTTVSQPKLTFISWCKDDCCGQDKLIHASSKQALKAELSGLNTPEFQCSELSELSFSEITKDLQKRDRV
ncbi:unnamed protein product, partial [Porites evermanni]